MSEAPARRSTWPPEVDALILELRGNGMTWDDISTRLPGRSAISIRLHYQNYLEDIATTRMAKETTLSFNTGSDATESSKPSNSAARPDKRYGCAQCKLFLASHDDILSRVSYSNIV